MPKTETVKLTFPCLTGLKADLDRYAELHAQTYGESVDAVTLIPHMLEAFMAGTGGSRRAEDVVLCLHQRHCRERLGPSFCRPFRRLREEGWLG
ncbi:DUF2274 domain-containing protein [Pollutimonas thiosulfatoxidans]|uniref:DUF2274 domain-containing protein n=1 Tax=Pollutimonas thiosulfatoxidans TaxID=2028345 RepID=A0A410GCA4_9BURK|nr:hypothetical protein CKA81_08685 [Pollutimonas thiosulfatoxidans]TEA80271.1 DUF2274 domain-containing protein [Allopusillimonas ginsengisoli]TFL14459.1 DUF2274 domain-containing protein [Pusillimonas caeni]